MRHHLQKSPSKWHPEHCLMPEEQETRGKPGNRETRQSATFRIRILWRFVKVNVQRTHLPFCKSGRQFFDWHPFVEAKIGPGRKIFHIVGERQAGVVQWLEIAA